MTSPLEAASSQPVGISVELAADARTYWDTEGIISKALTVALVRRDRPGLVFLPTVDPRAMMHPDQPLPGRPADDVIDDYPGVVTETVALDVGGGFGQVHQGGATYYLLASFSHWWTEPRQLRVTDAGERAAHVVDQPRPLPANAGGSEPIERLPAGLSLRRDSTGGRSGLRAAFRIARSPTSDAPTPWITVLGFNLRTRGGASGGVFEIPRASMQPAALLGEVVVPFSALAPPLGPGRWVFFAFVGDEASRAAHLDLLDADVGR